MVIVNVKRQQGAALFIALVFLVIITLIAITAMRTSTLELLMATNDQERRIALDAAASAVDAAVHSNEIKVGADGETTCFKFDAGTATPAGVVCDNSETLAAGAGTGAENFVLVTMEGIGTCPPSVASSARGASSLRVSGNNSVGGCAYYTIDSTFDATDRRGGRVETQQGFIRLAF